MHGRGGKPAGQQDGCHSGSPDRVIAPVGQHQNAVGGVADAEPAGPAFPRQPHLGQAAMQGLGEQRVRAEMLREHDLPGCARDGRAAGRRLTAGAARSATGTTTASAGHGPLGRGGKRLVRLRSLPSR